MVPGGPPRYQGCPRHACRSGFASGARSRSGRRPACAPAAWLGGFGVSLAAHDPRARGSRVPGVRARLAGPRPVRRPRCTRRLRAPRDDGARRAPAHALDVERGPIVAQSMGGRIALQVALLHPHRVSQLALFGPVGFGDVSQRRALAPFVPPLPGALPALLVPRRVVEIVQRRVHGKLGWFSERDIDEYWAPTQFPDTVRAQLQMLREFDWMPLGADILAGICVPALVVFGTLDRVVHPEHVAELTAAMPAGRLCWIDGGGHVVMEEVPDRVNTLLLESLGGGSKLAPTSRSR